MAYGTLLTGCMVLFGTTIAITIFRMCLQPIYGSSNVPSLTLQSVAIFALLQFNRWVLIVQRASMLRLWFSFCVSLPLVLRALTNASGWTGPVVGPASAEYGIISMMMMTAIFILSDSLPVKNHAWVADTLTMFTCHGLNKLMERFRDQIISSFGTTIMLDPRPILLSVATCGAFGLGLTSKKQWQQVLAGLLSALNFFVLDVSDAAINGALASSSFQVLDRRWSVTGYVSVLESLQHGFRILRCDHSLLGGQWITTSVREPTFAVFTMLEAVRLVVPNAHHQALCIGLGIGTAPDAMIRHGIDTTIVELDPVVHEFALSYFDFSPMHDAVIEDAAWAIRKFHKASFDIIIHDVFTGGAEPVSLFTLDFLRDLHELLTDEGVIVINFAGDLTLPSSSIMIRTILTVFWACRAFREHAVSERTPEEDLTNLAFFCRKSSRLSVEFRTPIDEDFLNSSTRRQHLLPKHEVDLTHWLHNPDLSPLRQANVASLEQSVASSRVKHWWLMRTVMPDLVWQVW